MTEMEKEAIFTGNKHSYSLLAHDMVVYLVNTIPITSKNYTVVLTCHLNTSGYHTY
jgi:hypothetical protein